MMYSKRLLHGTLALPPFTGEGNGMGADRSNQRRPIDIAFRSALIPTLSRKREMGQKD